MCKIKPCSHFYKTAFSQTNPRLRTPKGHPILAESRHKSFLWAALQILHCRCDFAGFHADFHDILSSSPSSEGLLKFPKKNFALKLVLLPWRQANWLDRPLVQNQNQIKPTIQPEVLSDEKFRGTSALVGYLRFFQGQLGQEGQLKTPF